MASSFLLSDFPDLVLDRSRLPRHVAIVMDGNGRWACQRGLARCYLVTETKRLMKRGVRVIVIGDTDRLPVQVRRALDQTVQATAGNRSMTTALALSYGGRQDVVNATRRIALAVAEGRLRPEEITDQTVKNELATAGMPDPDLLIRTSGELRISNFLLFQLAYTELYFTDTLWPDFRERDFLTALAAYQMRDRRFGGVENGPGDRLRAAN
ncbi:MAG: polyprenyl diphosphate synthase [Candidatus Binataceae bacterium]